MNIQDLEKFPPNVASRIEPVPPSTCWVWTGACTNGGYGTTSVLGRGWMVHRLVYTTLVGPIPAGLTLDHLCRARSCVNPAHLEPVSQRENNLRGDTIAARNAARTVCPKCGAKLAPVNAWRPRGCPSCWRSYMKSYGKEYYARNKEKRRAQVRAHYEANRDEILARDAIYRAANRGKANARALAYRTENRDVINARQRARHALKMAAKSAAESEA